MKQDESTIGQQMPNKIWLLCKKVQKRAETENRACQSSENTFSIRNLAVLGLEQWSRAEWSLISRTSAVTGPVGPIFVIGFVLHTHR